MTMTPQEDGKKQHDLVLKHEPVLLQEVIDILNVPGTTCVVDGTLGLGGHAIGIMQSIPSVHTYIGGDMDARHLAYASDRITREVSRKIDFHPVHSPFDQLPFWIQEHGFSGKVDALLLDLGLCSAHIDLPERGFSIKADGPLDMRFDESSDVSAATLVNTADESTLSTIIFQYGEERFARKIVKMIMERRAIEPFSSTRDLAQAIEHLLPRYERTQHPATRTFQALRIAVNHELDQLKQVLPEFLNIMAPNGHMAIITYHSLEDRIVKHFFRHEALDCVCENKKLPCSCEHPARVRIHTKKPITPSPEERAKNPRSRSAKLRIAISI